MTGFACRAGEQLPQQAAKADTVPGRFDFSFSMRQCGFCNIPLRSLLYETFHNRPDAG
ncbi:MAG: hypothetical protein VCA55_16345 [Verrucomicrobiales bacterium]